MTVSPTPPQDDVKSMVYSGDDAFVPAVDVIPAIPSVAHSPQSFRYETPRETAEDMCNGMYYDVFAIFMKFGKDKASIISDFGEEAGQVAETFMRRLMLGKNVRVGEIGECSYFFGVQLRPTITDARQALKGRV